MQTLLKKAGKMPNGLRLCLKELAIKRAVGCVTSLKGSFKICKCPHVSFFISTNLSLLCSPSASDKKPQKSSSNDQDRETESDDGEDDGSGEDSANGEEQEHVIVEIQSDKGKER